MSARFPPVVRTRSSDLEEPLVKDHSGAVSPADRHAVSGSPPGSSLDGAAWAAEKSTVLVDPVSKAVGTQARGPPPICQHMVGRPAAEPAGTPGKAVRPPS